jgi:quercetin dioxygenase-like cupin family protein
MKVKNANEVQAQPVAVEGAKDVRIRWLVHQPDGAGNFYLRQFELAPGGHTPRHQHAWEHEVYILAGGGSAVSAQGDQPITAGTALFVEPNEVHQFRAGPEGMKFLCIIPSTGK